MKDEIINKMKKVIDKFEGEPFSIFYNESVHLMFIVSINDIRTVDIYYDEDNYIDFSDYIHDYVEIFHDEMFQREWFVKNQEYAEVTASEAVDIIFNGIQELEI